MFTFVYVCLQKLVFLPSWSPESYSINSGMYQVNFENLQRPVKSRPVLTGDEFQGRETGQSLDSSCFFDFEFYANRLEMWSRNAGSWILLLVIVVAFAIQCRMV